MEKSHFLALAEESAIATFVYDIDDHTIVYKNPAFDALLDTGTDEIQVTRLKDILHPDDYEYALNRYSSLLNNKLNEPVQLRIVIPNRGEYWLRIMTSIHLDGSQKRFIYGNAVDVTAELTNQHTFAKYANKKDSILSILGHELAGSINIARMLSTALKSDSLGDAHNRQVNSVLQITKQALDLIKDLTNREFLETAEVVLNRRRVDISRKIFEYIEEVQKAEWTIKRTIYFNSVPGTVFIDIDEPKFMQIINNLISNALKFTSENGQIGVKVEAKDESVLFTVSDNGIGIPEKYHSVLFDPYTEAGRRGLQGEPSMGLGMNVIKNIVEWHQGRIWFESKEGEGSTFYFEIPR